MLVDSGLEGGDHDVLANLPAGGNGAASLPGDRQSDLLDSFAAVFVLMAVAFGPALTWLLVG
jgi:hypothetical protein